MSQSITNVYPNIWTLLQRKAEYYQNKPIISYGEESLYFDDFCGQVLNLATFIDCSTIKTTIGINTKNPLRITIGVFASLVASRAFWVTSPAILELTDSEILKDVYLVDDLAFRKGVLSDNIIKIEEEISGSMSFCWATSSGTQSKPKITEYNYHAIFQETFRQIENNRITSNDKIDILSSLSFSASLSSIFPAVFSGASLHVMKHSVNLSNVVDFWEREGITMTTMIPSLYRSLLKLQLDFKKLDLRFVCLGGEKVVPDDLKLFRNNFNKDVVLQVALASSEARLMGEYIFRPGDPVPQEILYSQVKDKKIVILNEKLEEVRNNQLGRIAIKSRVIGTKYLTKDKNFFITDNDQRMFVSDDLGYVTDDGKYCFIERDTGITKYRGEYIDIDEIGRKVQKNDEILESALIFNDDKSELHIFIYSKRPKRLVERLVRDQLNELSFQLHVFNLALPRLESGKIDYLKINKLASNRALLLDDREQKLFNVWKELFPYEETFDQKDFFKDLGGDSLKAVEISALIAKTFKTKIDPSLIFNYPVFNDLIGYINNEKPYFLKQVNKAEKSDKNILLFSLGGYTHYLHLIDQLKEDFNFYTLNFPIIENDGFLSPTEISIRCAKFLNSQEVVLHGFVGYSFSGLLAYCTAAESQIPKSVFLIDTPTYALFPDYQRIIKYCLRIVRFVLKILRYLSQNVLKPRKLLDGYDNFVSIIKPRLTSRKVTYKTNGGTQSTNLYLFYKQAVAKTIKLPNSKFKLGIYYASEQNAFKYHVAPNFDWDKCNTNVILKIRLEGNHSTILSMVNMEAVARDIKRIIE